jgi:hypothetical protein
MNFETRDTRICDSGPSVRIEQEKRLRRSSDKDRGGRMSADEYHAYKRTTMAYTHLTYFGQVGFGQEGNDCDGTRSEPNDEI